MLEIKEQTCSAVEGRLPFSPVASCTQSSARELGAVPQDPVTGFLHCCSARCNCRGSPGSLWSNDPKSFATALRDVRTWAAALGQRGRCLDRLLWQQQPSVPHTWVTTAGRAQHQRKSWCSAAARGGWDVLSCLCPLLSWFLALQALQTKETRSDAIDDSASERLFKFASICTQKQSISTYTKLVCGCSLRVSSPPKQKVSWCNSAPQKHLAMQPVSTEVVVPRLRLSGSTPGCFQAFRPCALLWAVSF